MVENDVNIHFQVLIKITMQLDFLHNLHNYIFLRVILKLKNINAQFRRVNICDERINIRNWSEIMNSFASK